MENAHIFPHGLCLKFNLILFCYPFILYRRSTFTFLFVLFLRKKKIFLENSTFLKLSQFDIKYRFDCKMVLIKCSLSKRFNKKILNCYEMLCCVCFLISQLILITFIRKSPENLTE